MASYRVAKWHKNSSSGVISKYEDIVHQCQTC